MAFFGHLHLPESVILLKERYVYELSKEGIYDLAVQSVINLFNLFYFACRENRMCAVTELYLLIRHHIAEFAKQNVKSVKI